MRARHVINVLVAATVVAALSSCISFEETPTTFSVGTTTGESVWWIRMADVTGDGTDDALIKTSTGTLVRYEYCREGCFARRESVAVTRLSPYGCQYQRSSNCGVIVGDFDNDGVDDVRTGTRILFGGPATGDRPAGLTLDDSVVVPSYATNPVAVGDFNGDGNLDLLNEETQYGYYLSDTAVFGDGAGGFTQGPFLGMNGPTNACSECYLFLADFDGDGTDEVYTGGVLGQGAWPAFDVTNGYAIGDIDEDGRDDLAVRAEDGEVTFWRSTVTGSRPSPRTRRSTR